MIGDRFAVLGKGITQGNTRIRNTKVGTMNRSFRSIHAAAFGTNTVIEQFSGFSSKHHSFVSLKNKLGYCSAVLTEIENKGLAGVKGDNLVRCIGAVNDHPSKMRRICLFYPVIDISLLRCERQVTTQIDLCSIRRQDLAMELTVDDRCCQFFESLIAHGNPRIIVFTIKDSSMGDRSCYTGTP